MTKEPPNRSLTDRDHRFQRILQQHGHSRHAGKRLQGELEESVWSLF